MLEKLKQRWGVDRHWQIVVILLVFSLAGSSILYVKGFVYEALHLSPNTSLWLKIPLFFFVYQILLLFYGTLLGQFRFFWEKEKKLFGFLIKPLQRKKRPFNRSAPCPRP